MGKETPKRVIDQRMEVVSGIVEAMKEKGLRWFSGLGFSTAPRNPLSGTVYRGRNRLLLSFVASAKGYEDPRWVTFSQARDAGWKMRKGARSSVVEKWKMFSFEKGGDEGESEDCDPGAVVRFARCVGYWSVFNASEFYNAPEYLPEQLDDDAGRIADLLIRSSRCPVHESFSDIASYYPDSDAVRIPLRRQYVSNGVFARDLLHEMIHSTGHPGALARKLCGRFGDPDYAFEELVAELGSLFAASDVGLGLADMGDAHYERHVAYLQSWIKVLEKDPDKLFQAASLASVAADYLAERVHALPRE